MKKILCLLSACLLLLAVTACKPSSDGELSAAPSTDWGTVESSAPSEAGGESGEQSVPTESEDESEEQAVPSESADDSGDLSAPSEESDEVSEPENIPGDDHMIKLADDLFEGGNFWGQNGEWLYYANKDGRLLGRVHLDGTNRQTYDNGGIASANVEHDRIYYVDANDGNRPYAMEHDGTGVTLLYDCNIVSGIEVVGGRIYFYLETDIPDPIESGYIAMTYSITKDGNDLREEPCAFPEEDGWVYTLVDVYGDRRLCKIRSDGSELTVLTEIEVESFEVYEDWIYYTPYRESGLFKIKTDGTEKQKICDDDVSLDSTHWHTTSFDQTRIYYLLRDDNDSSRSLYIINKDGTGKNLISEMNVTSLLYAFGDTVFFTVSEGKSFALYSVDADGANEQYICMPDHTVKYSTIPSVWRINEGIIFYSQGRLFLHCLNN